MFVGLPLTPELRQKNPGPNDGTDRWSSNDKISYRNSLVLFFWVFFVCFLFFLVHTAEANTGPAMLCIWPVFYIRLMHF